MSQSVVIPFPAPRSISVLPANVIDHISYEDFCIADANGGWSERVMLPGLIMLQYGGATIIGCCHGTCAIIRQPGTDLSHHLELDLAASA